MKLQHALLSVCLPLFGTAAAQTTYNDTTGEIAVGNHPHLDITSVVVSSDGTTVTFRINLNGNPEFVDWGKYLIGIRSGVGGATAGNGWARPINFAPGMTHWIGSWVDNGNGAQTFTYSGGSWSNTSSPSITKDSTGLTITETAANLGLVAGEKMIFDVYTSGGGGSDSAVDALSASGASITDWPGPYTTQLVTSETNAALEFTMPGTLTFANWITGFGLAVADQDPGDDPDGDGLTNQQEFDANLDLNPNSDDTDGDGLTDDKEDGTMVYNGPNDTGTFPAIFDSDGDGYNDGAEANGDLGFERDPTVRNFNTMTVAGNFPANTGEHWNANGAGIGTDMTASGDEDLVGQFGWSLDYHLTVLGERKYKFVGDHNWNNSWGLEGPSGNDIPFTITATGIHRWTFNSKTTDRTLQRATFADASEFLAAYGLSSGADEDFDGVNNEDEFTDNTDPKNPDTDGDGQADGADAGPLDAVRDVEFSVNMSVQIALGTFVPSSETVVVDFFDGVVAPLDDLALNDPDMDGIYTGTLAGLAGATGLNSGGYKFKIIKTGDDLFENDINNRSFTLGAGNPAQVLPTVYFNNVSTTFGLWAAANAGSGAADDDYDGDGVDNGVEYFMGETGSTFTANPQPNASRVVSWPRNPAATDAQFKIWRSTNLSDWTDVTGAADTSNPNFVRYTIPTGDPQVFVRFSVTVP